MILKFVLGYITYLVSLYNNILPIDNIDKKPDEEQNFKRKFWVLIGLVDFVKDIVYLLLYPHINKFIWFALIISIIAPFLFVAYYFEINNPIEIII